MRLDQGCARASGLGRKEIRDAIRRGEVTVDGIPEKKADRNVTGENTVCLRGEILDLREHVYFMLFKPSGTVSTTEDLPESVLKLFPVSLRKRLFCVGRLDKDTTGLLLLTDDGELDHHLMSPRHHAPKVYDVSLRDPLTFDAEAAVTRGVTLKDGDTTAPCTLERTGERTVRMTICEGKYHQVKRTFAAVGNEVVALHRSSVGGVALDPSLAPGQYRELTEDELSILRS